MKILNKRGPKTDPPVQVRIDERAWWESIFTCCERLLRKALIQFSGKVEKAY